MAPREKRRKAKRKKKRKREREREGWGGKRGGESSRLTSALQIPPPFCADEPEEGSTAQRRAQDGYFNEISLNGVGCASRRERGSARRAR